MFSAFKNLWRHASLDASVPEAALAPGLSPVASEVDPVQAVIDKLQGVVVADLSKQKSLSNVGLNPAILAIIAQVIQAVLTQLLNCNPAPKPAAAQANHPDFLHRLSLRVITREAMPGFDAESNTARLAIYNSCLAAGKTVTEEDMASMIAG